MSSVPRSPSLQARDVPQSPPSANSARTASSRSLSSRVAGRRGDALASPERSTEERKLVLRPRAGPKKLFSPTSAHQEEADPPSENADAANAGAHDAASGAHRLARVYPAQLAQIPSHLREEMDSNSAPSSPAETLSPISMVLNSNKLKKKHFVSQMPVARQAEYDPVRAKLMHIEALSGAAAPSPRAAEEDRQKTLAAERPERADVTPGNPVTSERPRPTLKPAARQKVSQSPAAGPMSSPTQPLPAMSHSPRPVGQSESPRPSVQSQSPRPAPVPSSPTPGRSETPRKAVPSEAGQASPRPAVPRRSAPNSPVPRG